MNFWGQGVFESLRCYKGEFFLLQEHLDRLFLSAHSLGWRVPYERPQIVNRMKEEVKKKGEQSVFVRVTLYRDCWNEEQYDLVATVIPKKEYPLAYHREGVAVAAVPTWRNSPMAVSPQVKSNNTLGGVLAYEEGKIQGVFESLLLNEEGWVTEGTISNFFIVKNGNLITAPVYTGILEGVTRDYVMRLANQEGIEIEETPLTRHDLYSADEAFLTNTSMGIMPVKSVDGRVVGERSPGQLTARLTKQLREAIQKWEEQIDQNKESVTERLR